MANGGFSDKVQILEESAYADGGVSGEVVFGITREFSWDVESNTNTTFGLETSGPQGTVNTDGVMAVSGTHTFEMTNGAALKAIMGTQGGSAASFTLNVADSLPSYTVKAVDDSSASKYIRILGIKYTQFSIALATNETVIVTADWDGKTIQNTTSFTPTAESVKPFTYLDGYWNFGVTALPEVESLNLIINRNNAPKRFIESTATGERRLISEIIEGVLNVEFDATASAQRVLLEEAFGGSTYQDERSDKAMSLVLSRGSSDSLTLTLANARVSTLGRTLEKEAEVAIQEFSGLALDISGSGSYSG